MANKTHIVGLFIKYLNGTIRPAELTELLLYFEKSQEGDDLTPLIQQELNDTAIDDTSLKDIVDKVETKLFAETMPTDLPAATGRSKETFRRVWWLSAAAAAIVFMGLSWFFWNQPSGKKAALAALEADIAPGSNRATLTLSNGRTIDLSTDQSGIVMDEEISYADGSLVAGQEPNKKSVVPAASQLTLTTPKGGTYRIRLPDGTDVWLNAASTLKYPSKFDERERVVELTGEAYFDVRHADGLPAGKSGRAWPFRVITNGQEVEVLGTEFNITAYGDEQAVKTTLVNGRIGVSTADKKPPRILAPGQQLTNRNGDIRITTVDVSDYTAWKEGQFVFYGTSFPELVKQIERWYDVSFEITVPVQEVELWGTVSREVMLSQILHVIALNTSLKFTREGRHIMVHH